MFVYEKGNSLNITFKGSIPVENPELVVKGYEDGATLTVNGTVYGNGSKEFEGRAKTFVFQKDGKLMITFKGVAGIENPDVTVDETSDGIVVDIDGTAVTLEYTADGVAVKGEAAPVIEEPVTPAKPAKEEEPEVTVEEDEEPDEVTEE